MKKVDNPLRIKVIGKCNRDCRFCHHEGGDNHIQEIIPNQELGDSIHRLCHQLHIGSIALTGGEPLKHPDLVELAYFLSSTVGIHKLYMTSNGTIRKDESFWQKMKESGLEKVNISVPDVMTEYKKNTDFTATESIFQNQLENIKAINKLGIHVDVNVVVFSDQMYTKYVVNTLNTLNEQGKLFHIYLLPNLTSGENERSVQVIEEVLRDMHYKKEYICSGINISNASRRYQNENGNQLFVKTTEKDHKVYMLPGFCDKCDKRDACLEGFYGLRLEKRNGIHYIRACLLKDTNETLIPLSEFFTSKLYDLLKEKWGGCV
jgi:Molybdenum cofactor biosynthesis enzyme